MWHSRPRPKRESMTYITERIIYKYINIIDYIHTGTGSNAHASPPSQASLSLSLGLGFVGGDVTGDS